MTPHDTSTATTKLSSLSIYSSSTGISDNSININSNNAKVSSDNYYQWTNTYQYLLIGRLFLGLGGESIVACSSTMIATWFTHNGYLNTAMALNQAFVQLFGSSAAFYLLPRLHSIDSVQLFTLAVGVFSLLCNFLYIYIFAADKWILSWRVEDIISTNGLRLVSSH